jgi:drug/metabolite transporter (DMT)-like permease
MEQTSTLERPDSPAWLWQLALLTLIWGSSFMLIKVALEDYGPLQVAFGRILVGAVTLLAILLVTRERLPRDARVWVNGAVIGLLMNAAPFSLVAFGEQHLGSVQAGIWNATTPLFVLIVLLTLRSEPLTRRRIGGLLLGFVGVLVVLAPWHGVEGGERIGHIAFAGMAACYGLGTTVMRRAYVGRSSSATALSAVQLVCATGWMLVAVLPTEGLPASPPALLPSLCIVALGALGTGIAYILFTNLVRSVGSATASSVTYLMPIVSTALGVLVLGETIGWNEPVGTVVILAGAYAIAASPARLATHRAVHARRRG